MSDVEVLHLAGLRVETWPTHVSIIRQRPHAEMTLNPAQVTAAVHVALPRELRDELDEHDADTLLGVLGCWLQSHWPEFAQAAPGLTSAELMERGAPGEFVNPEVHSLERLLEL